MKKWPDLQNRRKKLRLESFDYSDPNYIYFLTVCARHLTAPFHSADLAEQIIESLLFIRVKSGIRLYCYCLMPDHLHVVLSPSTNSGSISDTMRTFKSFTTNMSWKHGIGGKLWQKSFCDHIIRKDEDLATICEYILANPLRKGLVDDPEDWQYSDLPDPLPM